MKWRENVSMAFDESEYHAQFRDSEWERTTPVGSIGEQETDRDHVFWKLALILMTFR